MSNQKLEIMKTKEKSNNKTLRNVLLTFFIVAALGATFFAYQQYDENVQLQEFFEAEKLAMEEHVQQSFDKIESNLTKIAEAENELQLNFNESEIENPADQQARIQRKINFIESLIAENNRIIDELNQQVVEKDKKLAGVNKKVAGLNKKIKHYQTQMAELNEANEILAKKLNDLTIENQFLTLENEHQKFMLEETDKIIAQKDDTINMAFYITGSFDELKQANIVGKEGGIIGIGAAKTVQEDFSTNDFIQVDKRTIKTIPVHSKKAAIISKHPADSYELVKEDGQINYIKIIQPDLFWEKSKFLVIETKESSNLNLADKSS